MPSLLGGIVRRGGVRGIRSAADLACGQLLKRVVVRSVEDIISVGEFDEEAAGGQIIFT